MGKILTLLLGLGVTMAGAYYFLKGEQGVTAEGKSAPKARLDDVRAKAKTIEDDAQKRADDLVKKATPE